MNTSYDIAIIGSGFGGSLMAMVARRLGYRVVLIESGKHPRFVIGESTTPITNLLLETLAQGYDLPRLLPFTKWGTWRQTYPEIAVGLKRGFTFYHHTLGEAFRPDPARQNELLVAASPHDRIADTHWYRPDFDQFLMREAVAMGVEYRDETELEHVEFSANGATLTLRRQGVEETCTAEFVIDASGPRSSFQRLLGIGDAPFSDYPVTHTLYTHFCHVKRWDALHPLADTPPYPVDDAAVHHVFPGGWIWVLRFNNGITSAGVACTQTVSDELCLQEGANGWARLLERLPSVRECFAEAEATLPFVFAPRMAFRRQQIAGERWALLPSAAGFIDPLLSTGFPLTLLGIERLARILEQHKTSFTDLQPDLAEYAKTTHDDLGITAQAVAALYACMDDFPVFAAVTKLYFAAVMFSETKRRLGKTAEVNSFLLREHPTFAPVCAQCFAAVTRGDWRAGKRDELLATIREAVEPFDLAGLNDATRQNWHPCLAEDLLAGVAKLSTTTVELKTLLERAGFCV